MSLLDGPSTGTDIRVLPHHPTASSTPLRTVWQVLDEITQSGPNVPPGPGMRRTMRDPDFGHGSSAPVRIR
jgi:hypothetical protein